MALTFSVLLLVLPSLWLRLRTLTLLDAFLLSVAMYFGAYTLIDVALTETDGMKGYVTFVTFLTIAIPTFVLWGIARRPPRFVRNTSLERLRQDWLACPAWPLVGLTVISLLYRWYTASFIGDLGTISPEELALVDRDMPYWYTSVGMLVWFAAFPIALCSWAKFRTSKKLFWLAMTAYSVFAIFGSGRRAFLALMLIIGWDVLTTTKKRWKALLLIASALPLLLIASNLYQTYRAFSYRGAVLANVVGETDFSSISDLTQLAQSASDAGKTVSNLEDRMAMWRFNYEVIQAHFKEQGSPQWGGIIWPGLVNFIPSAIYPDKVVRETEGVLLKAFELPLYDRPENVFAMLYGEFGLFCLIAVPLFILGFVWVISRLMMYLEDPFLRMSLLGAAIFYALNLESALMEPIATLRAFALLAVCYVTMRGLGRVARTTLQVA